MELPMRRFVLNLAAAAVLTGPQAMAQTAQMQCLSPDQRALFQVQALRSEMMVLATACSDDSQYNAFVTRYQPELAAGEKAIDAWFKQKYGKRAQAERDRFVTELANAQSDASTKQGTDFCAHNGLIFPQAMAIRSGSELEPFAAGQPVVPASVDPCPVTEVAQAPTRKKAPTHR
jgi:hypothetical protein